MGSSIVIISYFFFFKETATTEIYTLSLHDALPICSDFNPVGDIEKDIKKTFDADTLNPEMPPPAGATASQASERSEEHTSELQSRQYLVCRLLLEKKIKHLHLYPSRS